MGLLRRKTNAENGNQTDDPQIVRLNRQIADIDKRLAVIDAELPQFNEGSYIRQERQMEKIDLLRLRRETQLSIEAMRAPPPSIDPQKQAVIEGWIAEQEENYDHTIARFEAQGDYRQARLWRMQRLKIRDEVERSVV
jgi:hypothetical protein